MHGWFFSRRPGYALLTAFFVATAFFDFIITWPGDTGDEECYGGNYIQTYGYCLVILRIWFLIQDMCKMLLHKFDGPVGGWWMQLHFNEVNSVMQGTN